MIILALIIFINACKKEEKIEFTATDMTGSTIVKGTITKNIIIPNGAGGYATGKIAASGINISIKIDKNALYPKSNAVGADIYNCTTDVNGNYSVTVKSNAIGVTALITIESFTGTTDTLINGITKTGPLSKYTGTTFTKTIVMGSNSTNNYDFNSEPINSNPNYNSKIGTAFINGAINIEYVKEILTGTLITYGNTLMPLEGYKVYLNFDKDPNTLAPKTYTTLTDANGYYSFYITTVEQGTTGFAQNANIYIPDFYTTRDTIKSNNTKKTGKYGKYPQKSILLNSLYNTNVRNGIYLNYNNFMQNWFFSFSIK